METNEIAMSTSSTTPIQSKADALNHHASLPELPYSLRTRKQSIAITWFIIWFMNSAIIQILYFSIRYATNVCCIPWYSRDHTTNLRQVEHVVALAITVAVLGVFTLLNICIRLWKLMRKVDPRRPANTSKWALDFFMYSYLLSFIVVTVVIASATTDPPKIRQASMPQTTVLFIVCIQILLSRIFDMLGMKTFCRFSSTPRGAQIPPASLIIMEDVVAVDGGGGPEFREALMRRYEASEPFRRLLRQMDWFWGIGGLLIAVGVTLAVFLNLSEIASFAIGKSDCS